MQLVQDQKNDLNSRKWTHDFQLVSAILSIFGPAPSCWRLGMVCRIFQVAERSWSHFLKLLLDYRLEMALDSSMAKVPELPAYRGSTVWHFRDDPLPLEANPRDYSSRSAKAQLKSPSNATWVIFLCLLPVRSSRVWEIARDLWQFPHAPFKNPSIVQHSTTLLKTRAAIFSW